MPLKENKASFSKRGKKNPMWKDGSHISPRGYKLVLVHGHPRADKGGYVAEHILIAENEIHHGPLPKGWVVHHKDHNKLNNKKENLMLFKSNSEHMKYEAQEYAYLRTRGKNCPHCGKSII